jgi:DNA-binding IclR family transcriptional regulator
MAEHSPVGHPKNETAARAMQVLSLYRDHTELGLREMSRLLGLSTSVTYRIADSLCHYQFLQQLPSSRRYVLGSAFLELAQRFRENDKFVATCIAHMDGLRDRTQETVALHVFRDGLRFAVLESQSSQSIRHVMRPGTSYTVTHGCADIIIRALADRTQTARIRHELRQSGETVRAPRKDELDHFRARGWAMSDGARTPGAFGIAAPVPHPEGLYVLSLLGPRDRVLATGIEALAVQVVQAAKDLGYALSPLHASL